ncbi:MAG: methionine adenosyltransferase [Methyloligellaceae bacterium]
MSSIRVETLERSPPARRSIEIVERKGIGHPDTICDMLSERLSVALSAHYRRQFGLIHHHNVDKALLAAGRSAPAFGGGRLLEPIDIYLSGRATMDIKGEKVPVEELAHHCVAEWFGTHFHALDPERHVRVHCLVRPGSPDLVDVFMRQEKTGTLLCNDTSCGVGFAPLTELERMVLEVERDLNAPDRKAAFPAFGQDIKVMGVRDGDAITLTVACAFIGQFLGSLKAYAEAKEQLAAHARELTSKLSNRPVDVQVNTADDMERGAVYLTVTGTSAESGDDGETGRGNRANGLITPLRPMTMEAAAGKNPVTHVGKLYNTTARLIAETAVAEIDAVTDAECYLVSKVGAPIDAPQIALIRARTEDRDIAPEVVDQIEAITARKLASVKTLWRGFLEAAHGVA